MNIVQNPFLRGLGKTDIIVVYALIIADVDYYPF